MELTWHNCKTCPPQEFENNSLIVTNGNDVYGLSWHRAEGYWIETDEGLKQIDCDELEFWWWADIEQTVRLTEQSKWC
jgi:hypothetical protein